MLIQPIRDLINQNFNVVFLNAMHQFWRNTRYFQCIGEPKRQNLLLFLRGYEITYTDKYGNVTIARSGDVVYTPVGSEYRADIVRVGDEDSHTVGINFNLLAESGESVAFSDKISIFRFHENSEAAMLFERIADESDNAYIQKRILLLRILGLVGRDNTTPKSKKIISPGLSYLVSHLDRATSVAELAKLCNISEGYFRKQFRLCMGMTPVEYRNRLRLDKARTYLEYGDISVQEISDMLGYATVSHFIKEFKSFAGISPLKYRKKFRS